MATNGYHLLITEKRNIIGSIFPEKWVFDGEQHRTARINELTDAICLINKELDTIKNGTNLISKDLSHQVTPMVQSSNTLVEDLRLLEGIF